MKTIFTSKLTILNVTTPKSFIFVLLMLLTLFLARAAHASIAGEIVERLVQLSGRTGVDDATKIAAKEALERGMATYGSEVAEVAERGGFGLTEAAARHGDAVWRLARLSSEAPLAVSARPEALLTIARRWGDEAALIEIKAPGCGETLASRLGKSEIQALAAGASSSEIKRLAALAVYRTPAELEVACRVWKRGGGAILEHVTPQRIAAVGFAVAMITAAWKVPGAVIALVESALIGFLGPLVAATSWGLLLLVLILCQGPVLWLVRSGATLARRAYQAARNSPASNA